MPNFVKKTLTSGTCYANPFIGLILATANLMIHIATLTTREVDANGYLKPGVAFNRYGRLIGGPNDAGTAVSAPVAGNTGNGAMGAVTVSNGAKAGVYRLTCFAVAANAGKFMVEDPAGLQVGVATVGVAFSGGGLAFTLADGATDFVAGDSFTITTTLTAGGPDADVVFGVVREEIKIADDNTSLSTLADTMIGVTTAGLINRDIAEDNLESAYTAAEIAGLAAGGFKLTN